MKIIKQITVCKSDTELKIYTESTNEIGLWIAHTPCFVISSNDVHLAVATIKKAFEYSNSGLSISDDAPQRVLKELHIRSWNTLYKTHKIISFSLTEANIIITPWICAQKGMVPDSDAKCVFNISDYNSAIKEIFRREKQ